MLLANTLQSAQTIAISNCQDLDLCSDRLGLLMLETKISSTLAISTFSFSEHDFPPQLSKQTMSLCFNCQWSLPF